MARRLCAAEFHEARRLRKLIHGSFGRCACASSDDAATIPIRADATDDGMGDEANAVSGAWARCGCGESHFV